MTANCLRSAPIVIIATAIEATTILDALGVYRGRFGGESAEYLKRLETEEDPLTILALKNDIKSEQESIKLAKEMAQKIGEALTDNWVTTSGGMA